MAVLDSVPYISLKNTRWLYRGEGNANLVITIPEDKIILRFEKCDYGTKSSSEIIEKREKKLKMDVLFYEKIIVSFLGKEYIQPPTVGRISSDEVIQLDEELISQRPSYRLDKGIQYEMVTIHPDYCYLPPTLEYLYQQNGKITTKSDSWNMTFSVEIKPKQGWVYPQDRYHPKCTYCLNQYLKVKKKRVVRISHYCPLDLFSGNIVRMKKAIRSLLSTPQNNLKIFQNGKLVYSDESKGNQYKILRELLEPEESGRIISNDKLLDKWCCLIIDALLKELTEEPSHNIPNSHNECYESNIINSPLYGKITPCDWTSDGLPANCILQRILMMQMLQNVSFRLLYELYRQRKDAEENYNYVERLLHSPGEIGSVERYLLATTAKDCSIFLAFRRTHAKTKNGLQNIQDCDGMLYQMNIGISDIDPKPLSCIEKHFKRDQGVVDTILKHIEESG